MLPPYIKKDMNNYFSYTNQWDKRPWKYHFMLRERIRDSLRFKGKYISYKRLRKARKNRRSSLHVCTWRHLCPTSLAIFTYDVTIFSYKPTIHISLMVFLPYFAGVFFSLSCFWKYNPFVYLWNSLAFSRKPTWEKYQWFYV